MRPLRTPPGPPGSQDGRAGSRRLRNQLLQAAGCMIIGSWTRADKLSRPRESSLPPKTASSPLRFLLGRERLQPFQPAVLPLPNDITDAVLSGRVLGKAEGFVGTGERLCRRVALHYRHGR